MKLFVSVFLQKFAILKLQQILSRLQLFGKQMSDDANPSDFQTTDNSNLCGDSPQNNSFPKQFFDVQHECSVVRDKQIPALVDPNASQKNPSLFNSIE